MISLSTSGLMNKISLDDILGEDDELGLLDVQPLKAKATPVDIAGGKFAEIIAFYKQHHRLPEAAESAPLAEKMLARRLRSIQENPEQFAHLHALDEFGWLQPKAIVQTSANIIKTEATIDKSELVTSLADIFADDDDGLLDFEEPDLFSLKNVPADKKEQPDEIAQRKVCADFSRFAPLFSAFSNGLRANEFKLQRFTHKLKIAAGDFFTLNGLTGYVVNIGEQLEGYKGYNARLHLVFENGTEMYMLYQSLTHGLVRDKSGRKGMLNGSTLQPSTEAIPTGYVYILRTLSTDPVLAPYKANLYKIGFTSTSVEERVKNAESDRTFLEAPVKIIAVNECFNLNTQKLEALVHGFLAARRLNITMKSYDGQIYTPREWFNVPIDTALLVTQLIADGSISHFRLDNTTGKIVAKKSD
ncbi:MAG: GIY-YIG nuclease family protein [Plesiomonas shigelloides]